MKSEHFHFYFYVYVNTQAIIEFRCVGDHRVIGLYFEDIHGYVTSEMRHLGIKEFILQNGERIRSQKLGCSAVIVNRFENDNLIQKFKDSLVSAGITEVSE